MVKITWSGTNGRGKWDLEFTGDGDEWSVRKLPVVVPTPDGCDPQMCCVATVAHAVDMIGATDEDEAREMLDGNTGLVGTTWAVVEFTGRDGSSDNLTPDWAIDGFTNEELAMLLQNLDAGLIQQLLTGSPPAYGKITIETV